MMQAIRRSISRKLMLVVLATTLMALVIHAVAMLIYDTRTYQTSLMDDLTTQAGILGKVSLPALEFNDPKVARENLEKLRSRANILAAAIYTPGGKLFAVYTGGESVPPTIPRKSLDKSHVIDGGQIAVYHRIVKDGEMAGIVYLRAKYELVERLTNYLKILLILMLGSFLVAAMISTWLQAAITKPIHAVTDIAREVIRTRDFSLRVRRSTEDEIGILVDAFNSMLSEVDQRARALETSNAALKQEMNQRAGAEAAIRQLNETLEQRIAVRTAELEQAHEQLRQAQKMEAVGQLTGGIAHDFNNLLASMLSNMEMMQIRIAQGKAGDLERYLESAISSIDRASALTHRLLAFSRRQTLDPKPININRLVMSMEELIRRTVGPAVSVETDLDADLWNTMCDPHQLENALLNLAINARDAMPDGGKLLIGTRNVTSWTAGVFDQSSARMDGDYVAISVSDSGMGMTPEVLAKAFDPFFTTKPLGQGTGLGLSMVYGFVNQSGGNIRIESEPGRGTTVHLFMRKYAGNEGGGLAEQSMPGKLRVAAGSSILVVDDEAPIRALVAERLTELGYSIHVAVDAQDAMLILQSDTHIDLMISDVGLPNGMNGRQLADVARSMRPDLKILFITGYAQANVVRNDQLEAGMSVLVKPFRLDALAARVGAMLGSEKSQSPA